MRNLWIFCGVLILSTYVDACGDFPPLTDFSDEDAVNFGLALYRTSFTAAENYVSSPVSIRQILAMVYLGTVKESNSELELQKHAKFDADKSKLIPSLSKFTEVVENNSHLKIANKILVDKRAPLRPEYKSAIEDGFRTSVQATDFTNAEAVVADLNKWVTNKTAGFIKEVLRTDDVYADLRLLLVNSISFKAQWKNKFSEEDTEEGAFYANGKTHKVQLMTMMDCFRFNHNADLKVDTIELPYEDGSDFVMWILLPNENSNLAELVDGLTYDNLKSINDGFHSRIVDVVLPKFEIKFKTNGKAVLEKMGLESLFKRHDLNIFNGGPVGVSDLIQNTRIKVNEDGTEAGGATYAGIRSRILPALFIVNRPFAFMILNESTKKPIFLGHYSNPESKV